MTTVAEMIRRLESLKVQQSVVESIEETKDAALSLNALQLQEGVRSDGERIQWLRDSHYPYTKPYARQKAKKGFQVEVVDLNATSGKEFYKTEQIKVEGSEIQYQSNIKLGQYLEQNYGVKIWGLTNESRAEYIKQNFFPSLKKRIEGTTGLQFS
jgi:hypothetical protein